MYVVCLVFVYHVHFYSFFFFFNDTATTEIYTLSLHDALPIVVVLGFLKGLVLHQTSFREVGGIITVGQISGQVARLGLDWLLTFVAFFSINLAILNLLPIPILDGGQLMFLIAEAVRGKPLSRELRTRLSNVGFFLLVVIMVLALTNDAIRILPR